MCAAILLRERAFAQIGHLKMSFSCRGSALVIRSVLPCRNILSSLVSPKINNQLSKVKKRSCDKAILIKTNPKALTSCSKACQSYLTVFYNFTYAHIQNIPNNINKVRSKRRCSLRHGTQIHAFVKFHSHCQ